MDHAETLERGAGLIGREPECAEIDRLLEDARAGASGSLVIRGEAGIGKSALIDYTARRAAGMIVLRTTGVAAESDLPFAGIYGLLRPIVGKLGELPGTQSAALAGALGLARSVDADRLLVSAAVLGLLAAAAEERPVLCLVDDAQWLDRPSADALVFTARRLGAERVAILFSAREGEAHRFEGPGLPERMLGGLDAGSSTAILTSGVRAAAPGVLERLLVEAHGNPLALLELPGGLTDAQLSGQEALPDAIPLTPRLQGVFRQRIERLPEATQMALLVAAADDTLDVLTVLRACAELALADDVLDPAESAGLVRTSDGVIAFRHPLVRSALYEGATLSKRQRAHRALACALDGAEHADRRVWHQAVATYGPDEDVAASLESSARRSRLRAAHASAATAYLRAAALSADESARTRRLAAAAQASWDGGQPDRARDAIAAALPGAEGELKAQLLYLKGIIETRTGSLREAYTVLLAGVEATTDPSLKFEMLQEAGEAAAYAGDMRTVVEIGQMVTRVPPVSERDHFQQAAAGGWIGLWAGDHAAAEAAFADALGRAAALADPRALVWAADTASVSQGLGAGLAYANRAVEIARTQGLLSLLPLALHRQAQELLWNSEFSLAFAAAHEGYRLAVDIGHGTGGHLASIATVEAVWGRDDDARAHADEALAIGRKSGSSLLASGAEFTLGFVELSAGRSTEVVDRLLALTAADRRDTHPTIALAAVPDLVEAAVRAGRSAEIAEAFDRYQAWVDQAPTDAGKALLARCRALLGERAPDAAFGEAIQRAEALPPFQRARTELLYGEWLRRERRRQEARPHLRASQESFRSLGAIPWEQRAEAELRATGESARRRDPSTLDQLTPQELQIAGLVAGGMTNREIASQLYLSPRTIDYHLRKVFTKLGIAARNELTRLDLK